MLVWFVETTIVAGILAVVAIGAGRLRSIPPSARHALWLVVLIKFLTPPLVCWPWAFDWHSLRMPGASSQSSSAEVVVLDRPQDVAPAASPGDDVSGPETSSEGNLIPALSDNVVAAVPLGVTESPDTVEEPRVDQAETEPAGIPHVVVASPVTSRWPVWLRPELVSRVVLFSWISLSVVIAIGQAVRIVRFRRRLRAAFPAPDHLVDEAYHIGRWLGVAVPDLHVIDDLGTPMLWCLGRPKLLLPTHLVKTLSHERWRGILTHELAHLRRRDQWVSRLELAAGLIWWWNPIYWLARARLDAEAELACDAWVVWALPKDRLTYAEVLFDICSNLLPAKPMAPSLSVAGSGRFFERRLTMILHNHVPCRLSPTAFLGACLLVLVALPTWSIGRMVSLDGSLDTASAAAAAVASPDTPDAQSALDDDDDEKAPKGRVRDDDADDDEDDDDDADDDEDDDEDDNPKALARARAKAAAAAAKVKEIERKLEAGRGKVKAKEGKAAKKPGSKGDAPKIEKELEEKLGPGSDFEKQMEQLGEKIGKEMEEKFGSGSEFEKQMEKLGKDIEAKFGDGSEFAKKMEAFGKEIESKFGDGSEFAKKMEAFGKEMEEKFGDGSDFAKKMEGLGKEMEGKFGPGSDFEKQMKKLGEEMKEKYGPGSDFAKKLEDKTGAAAKAKAKIGGKVGADVRSRKISALEDQIAQLMKQIEELKAKADRDEKDDD